MLNRKQIIVISSVVLLMAFLYTQDLKGLIAPKDQKNTNTKVASINIESISAEAKQLINRGLVLDIERVERELSRNPNDIDLKKQLAQKWDDVNIKSVSGLYLYEVAIAEPSLDNWLKSGDQLRDGYKLVKDSISREYMLDNAILSYEKALAIDPANLQAKTGLGVCYVEGTANPMSGIQLLLSVVEADPNNVPANLNLALFSMKTGQYDKAEQRLLTVAKAAPDAEVYFYLGETYRNLGERAKAVKAFEECKRYIVEPAAIQTIDRIINELK